MINDRVLPMGQEIENEAEIARRQLETQWQASLEIGGLVAGRRHELRVATSDFFKVVAALLRTLKALPDPNAVWRRNTMPLAELGGWGTPSRDMSDPRRVRVRRSADGSGHAIRSFDRTFARSVLEQKIARAEKFVAEGHERLAAQRARIADPKGTERREARSTKLLEIMEETQKLQIDHLKRLRRELEAAAPSQG